MKKIQKIMIVLTLSVALFASQLTAYAAETITDDTLTTMTSEEEAMVSPRSIASGTKSGTIIANNSSYPINVTGTFVTQYNSSLGRQVFSSLSSITSTSGGSAGSWSEVSYDYYFTDSMRTAVVTVSGYFKPSNQTTEYLRTFTVEFYCGSNGSVS